MIYLTTQKGSNKSESEDAVLIGKAVVFDTTGQYSIPEEGFVCVADGVGGNKGGKVAAHYLLNTLANTDAQPQELQNLILQANENLLSEAQKNSELREMATTLSGIYISSASSFIVHIGNSRVYARQGDYLKQLTTDHTVANWLRSHGRFEEAKLCRQNEITACLGGGKKELSNMLSVTLLTNYGTLLFTTDGVHDYVSIDQLESIVANGTNGMSICNEILDTAVKAGSQDDLTVVLLMRQEDNNGI